jgi:hypothetical protein
MTDREQPKEGVVEPVVDNGITRGQFLGASGGGLLALAGLYKVAEIVNPKPGDAGIDEYGDGGYGGYLLGEHSDPMQSRKNQRKF